MVEMSQHDQRLKQLNYQFIYNIFTSLMEQTTALERFTNETHRQFLNKEIALHAMTYETLEQYYSGLVYYKPGLMNHIQNVKRLIEDKKPEKKRAPTTAQKSTNYWSAMGIIFLCLCGVLTGGPYSISQIQNMQTQWLRNLLIGVVLGVIAFMSWSIYNYIWPRRDIRKFKTLFEDQEQQVPQR